jgi:hypothetical protein
MNIPNSAALSLPIKFDWHVADINDAKEAYVIHLDALQGVANGLVRADNIEHFERHASTDGVMVCCKSALKKMVAYAILGTTSKNADNLAELMGVSHAERSKFAILDGVATRPEWRGFHLHQASITERVWHAKRIQRMLIGATVSPRNYASLRGLLSSGFTIIGYALIYGGLERLLLMRDLSVETVIWRPGQSVVASDVNAHCAALANGLFGYACNESRDGNWCVDYGIPIR